MPALLIYNHRLCHKGDYRRMVDDWKLSLSSWVSPSASGLHHPRLIYFPKAYYTEFIPTGRFLIPAVFLCDDVIGTTVSGQTAHSVL